MYLCEDDYVELDFSGYAEGNGVSLDVASLQQRIKTRIQRGVPWETIADEFDLTEEEILDLLI